MANQHYWDKMWKDSPLLDGEIQENQNEYLSPQISRCIDKYCDKSKLRFLEAGCGLGIWNFWAEKKAAGCFSLGIDKTASLWQAQEYKRKFKYKSRFVQADVTHLPLKDETFNFITSLGVIEHFQNPQDLLVELKRLLSPGGILFLDTPNKSLWSLFTKIFDIGEDEDYFRPHELADLLKSAGFEPLESYSVGFSNTIMTPLYVIYEYNSKSFLSRLYHFFLGGIKFLITPLDKFLDKKFGFYSIVIARKI